MDIDKDDFPSEQANGDTGEDTALQLPPEVQTIAGASELTAPARKLSENRKEPVQSAITVPQEVADSQNSAFSEFFDETTDRISGTRFLMMLQTGAQRAVFSKQGITISIPKDALPEGIQNEDQIFLFRFPSMELCSTFCRMYLSCCPIQMTRQPAHCSFVMKAAWKFP